MLRGNEFMIRGSRRSSTAQLLSMEVNSQVLILPAEKEEYIKQRVEEGGLTDQRLLASIIAKTNPANLKRLWRFWNAYSTIFTDELSALKGQLKSN